MQTISVKGAWIACAQVSDCMAEWPLHSSGAWLLLQATPTSQAITARHALQTFLDMRLRHGLRRGGHILQTPFIMFTAFTALPFTPFVAMLHLLMDVVVLLMVGSLCVRHWWLCASGTTYVGSLRGEHLSSGGARPDCFRSWSVLSAVLPACLCSVRRRAVHVQFRCAPALSCLPLRCKLRFRLPALHLEPATSCRVQVKLRCCCMRPSSSRICTALHTAACPVGVKLGRCAGTIENLRYVFGNQPVAMWMLPSMQRASEQQKVYKGA